MVRLHFVKKMNTEKYNIFYSIVNLYENILIGYGRRHYITNRLYDHL